MTHLIGITGKARAGKDTVASMIMDRIHARRRPFAEPIKNMVRVGLGLTAAHTDGDLKESEIEWLGKSPRELMQTLGTEWGRDLIHEEIWLLLAQREWKTLSSLGCTMIVPDVRFPNEAEWIREHGKLIHVFRDDAAPVSEHSSEGGIAYDNSQDYMVCNNGSLTDLQGSVNAVIQAIR